jgi:hypothetical protein
LEYVGRSLDLFNCKNLTSLASLKYVGGYLDLRNTPIADMYSLKEIKNMIKVNLWIDI